MPVPERAPPALDDADRLERVPHQRTWLVVFRDSERRGAGWWRIFTRPGYRHVFAIAERAGGTVIVNAMSHRLDADWIALPIGSYARELLERHGCWIVAYTTSIPPRPVHRPICTCVEIVKAVLGIRAPWVLTPWQLYRWLRRRGAAVVLPLSLPQQQEV